MVVVVREEEARQGKTVTLRSNERINFLKLILYILTLFGFRGFGGGAWLVAPAAAWEPVVCDA